MGATHRKIAKEADIPLGSMTYHFNSIEDVFVATFSCFAEEASSQFESILQAAQTREEAVNAVVEIICGNFWAERQGRALTLSYELYAYSTRSDAMKCIMRHWMGRVQTALNQHFDVRVSKMLDAMIEGLSIHRSVQDNPLTRAEIHHLIKTLTFNFQSNDLD